MKLFTLIFILSSFAFAQNVGVKVDDVDGSENTTIEIKKGNKSKTAEYEIVQGEDSIEGETAPLLKDARSNWTKACSDWKKELKELNKDNTILTAVCGTKTCSTQAMETVCTSKASYKLKVRTN